MDNSEMDLLRHLLAEAAASADKEMLEAIEAWFEYWDDRYDGEPLKDYEIKMLAILHQAGLGPYRNIKTTNG